MARSKYDKTFPRRAEAFLKQGHPERALAAHLGISRKTLARYKRRYPAFSESVRRGRAPVDDEVERALLKRALGFSESVTEQRLTREGDVVDCAKEVFFPPDVAACAFWLKNRRPDLWSDRQAGDVNIHLNMTFAQFLKQNVNGNTGTDD